MNVVIYSRVSSQSAMAIDRTAGCRSGEVRSRRGYEVTAVFEEDKRTKGADIERPVLPLPEYCTDPQNRVDMLLLTEISRLGRSTLRS